MKNTSMKKKSSTKGKSTNAKSVMSSMGKKSKAMMFGKDKKKVR